MADLNYNRSKLEAVETEFKAFNQKIEAIRTTRTALKQALSADEQIELESFDQTVDALKDTLTDLKQDKQHWAELILVQTNGKFGLESKSFREASLAWTRSVTGINTEIRIWDPVLDDAIRPSETFKAQFEDTTKFVHIRDEAGRWFFLNLFALDIVKRIEFEGSLKIFRNPDGSHAIKQRRSQKAKTQLYSRLHYWPQLERIGYV